MARKMLTIWWCMMNSDHLAEREIKADLIRELKSIRGERDFILGTVSAAGSVEICKKLLEFIHISKEEGEVVSSDDILALVLVLRRESDDHHNMKPRKMVAAML